MRDFEKGELYKKGEKSNFLDRTSDQSKVKCLKLILLDFTPIFLRKRGTFSFTQGLADAYALPLFPQIEV